MALSPKHQAFADYYIETGNATESAKRAGYSEKTGYAQGCRLLKDAEISAYINARLSENADKRIADAMEVMEFLTAVMRGEVRDAFDLDPSLDVRINAGKELMKRYAAAEKNSAAEEKLDQLLEEFKDAVESEAT